MLKVIGENYLYQIVSKLYNCLGKRKFVREVVGGKELNYEQVKEIWNDELTLVHGDMTKSKYYFSCINEILEFTEKDNVVDIGCGDGTIDSYIQVNKLLGIDISENKLKEAKQKNPNYMYCVQSFLDEIKLNDLTSCNKCFSYGVVQYCKPEDIDKLIKNSLDVILKGEKAKQFNKKMVAHLEIPDIEKAFTFYHRNYGISEKEFAKYKNNLRTVFSDGSYWHDMRGIKEKCLKYIEQKGINDTVIVYLNDSHCYYRTDLVMILIEK